MKDGFGGAFSNGAFSVPSPTVAGPSPYVLQTSITLGGPGVVVDRIFADGTGASAAFANGVDYTQHLGAPRAFFVTFDYYGSHVPSGMQLYFSSSSNPSVTWYYDLSPRLQAGVWQNFFVQMSPSDAGWTGIGPTPNMNLALADVDEIGFQITYRQITGINQFYEFDGFSRGYAVPEPGTYAALGFALSSLGFTFRRKLNASVDRIKELLRV